MNKLLLYAVSHHAESKPVIIWVPNRNLTRQIARDILTHANADDTPKRYLHCSPEDLAPLLKHVKSRALQECLALGVGLFHEAMTENEREVVQQLFRSGAIQIVVATHNMCWDLHASSHLVVVMGSEYYDGKLHKYDSVALFPRNFNLIDSHCSYVDYSITDMLQMLGKAGRPNVDTSSKAVIFAYSRKKEFFKKFIYEPLPIESHLDQFLHDHLNASIVTQNVTNKQDAVDFLTWTFFYRRIAQNPNYYNLTGVTHRLISDYLSELIETTLSDLEKSRCITIENEMDVSALNLGMIAAYYYIRYTTIELFNAALTKGTKMKGLIEILSHATEFESLAIRQKENDILGKLASHLPVKISKPDFHSTATKVNVLLQSYFSRRVLSPDLVEDQNLVLRVAPRLLQGLVDVISSNGCTLSFAEYRWRDCLYHFVVGLNPAIAAMELSQMIIQAMWDNDSPLKQLPHFTPEVIDRYSLLSFQYLLHSSNCSVILALRRRSPSANPSWTSSTLTTNAVCSCCRWRSRSSLTLPEPRIAIPTLRSATRSKTPIVLAILSLSILSDADAITLSDHCWWQDQGERHPPARCGRRREDRCRPRAFLPW